MNTDEIDYFTMIQLMQTRNNKRRRHVEMATIGLEVEDAADILRQWARERVFEAVKHETA